MAIINTRNHGLAIGRLASDPRFFENKDGSRTVQLTVMVDQNWTRKDGSHGADAVPVERFIPADRTNGVFDMINKGDLVEVTYHVTTDSWETPNGRRYATKIIADDVQMLEPKSVTNARLKARVREQEDFARAQQAQAAQMQTQAPAQVAQDQLPLDLNESPFGIDQDNPPF